MAPLNSEQRQQFDDLLDQIIELLPDQLQSKLEEVPVIVEDEPSALMLEQLGIRDGGLLCGLHWGISLPARSVEHSGALPDRIWLFRQPIMAVARWEAGSIEQASESDDTTALARQIRITLLHEIGHHFGLDEQQLSELGYG